MQNILKNNKHLGEILSNHFIKFSLIPILIIEISLIILYFSINSYISSKNISLLLKEAQSHSQTILENEATIIEDKLIEISRTAIFLQNLHQDIMTNPQSFLLNTNSQFKIAPNGVFYKTNNNGSSLYYSSKTKITKKQKDKAILTEAMDVSLKSVVDTNPMIKAAYFNTWDNMNRLYPFIDKVYEQYGEHIQMENYNFYYLADLKHNPQKKPVWTNAYLDPAGNGWMLSCVVPIYNKDFLEGVTGLDITIDNLVKNILNKKLPYDANLFLVDKEGMIITMPEEFNVLADKGSFASLLKNLLVNDMKYSTLKIGDKEYLTLQENIQESQWKLIVLIDKNKVFASIESLKKLSSTIGYLAIIFLLFFYIIFFYFLLKRINIFSDSITKPIINLSNQTSQISAKNTNIEILDTNISEIHQLSSNFVSMVNELNERTKRLYNAKIIAEEANKSKDDFLANMSHELKTPLNSINIISNIMMKNKSENLDEKQVKNLEIIHKCGVDLLYLINDILDLSKLDAKQNNINNTKIDVKEFMNSIYEMFYAQTNAKNIALIFKVNDNLDFIYNDQEKIKQIIKNLLSNALKFTQKGKIHFLVEDSKSEIKITIQDDGIGIPQDKIESIFDRFKQLDGARTRKYAGTGLGLTICKELISLLNGKINISSKIDVGSSFEILIPKNMNLASDMNIKDSLNEVEENSSENMNLNQNLDFVVTKQSIQKEHIYVLNNDPISFFNLIIELNKKYQVKQLSKVEQLFLLDKEEKNPKIIIDISKLKNSDKQEIETLSTNNLILFYEEYIDNNLKNKASKVYQKPLSHDILISL